MTTKFVECCNVHKTVAFLATLFPIDIVSILHQHLYFSLVSPKLVFSGQGHIESLLLDADHGLGIVVNTLKNTLDTLESGDDEIPPPPEFEEYPNLDHLNDDNIDDYFLGRPESGRSLQLLTCSSFPPTNAREMKLDIDDGIWELHKEKVYIQSGSIGCYAHKTCAPVNVVNGDDHTPSYSRMEDWRVDLVSSHPMSLLLRNAKEPPIELKTPSPVHDAYLTTACLFYILKEKCCRVKFDEGKPTTLRGQAEAAGAVESCSLPPLHALELRHVIQNRFFPVQSTVDRSWSIFDFDNESLQPMCMWKGSTMIAANDNVLVFNKEKEVLACRLVALR